MHKVTINSTDIKTVCGRLSKVIQSDHLTTILESALMRVANGRAVFLGLDSEFAISTSIPVQHEADFAVAIHFKELDDAGKVLPPGVPTEFTITDAAGDGALIHIRCGLDTFDIPGTKGAVYPNLPSPGDEFMYDLDPIMIADFSISREFQSGPGAIPKLQGTVIQFKGGIARLIACDSGSLFQSQSYEATDIPDMSLIMPAKISDMLATLKGEGVVNMRFTEQGNWIGLHTSSTTLYCRRIDDFPPPYSVIIDMDMPGMLKVQASEMSNALRVAIVGVLGSKVRISTFSIKSNKIEIRSSDSDKGKKSSTMVDLQETNEIEFEIRFNPETFAKCMRKLNGMCTIRHCGVPNRQFTMRDEDNDALYVVMPMTVTV